MPFLVAILEHFYGQIFAVFIKYNAETRNLLIDEKPKISTANVLDILNKKTTLEQIIAHLYNFQNLDSINKAYKKYLSIDLRSILAKTKKVNGRQMRILAKIEELLNVRHNFIHRLDIDYSLSKEVYLNYVSIIEITIQLTVESLRENGYNIDTDIV